MRKAFVNTKHSTLHCIVLSEMSMLLQVFSCAARALYWAQLVVTREMAGILRSILRARMRYFGHNDAARDQFVVASIPCCFAFFAHLVQVTRHFVNSSLQSPDHLALMDSMSHVMIRNECGKPRGPAQNCWTSSLAATGVTVCWRTTDSSKCRDPSKCATVTPVRTSCSSQM